MPLPTGQQFIRSGSTYTGSRILRETLSKATKRIDIQDNFVGVRLLDILEQVFTENPNLEIRLLTKDGRKNDRDLKHFIQELPVFQKQFPKLEIKSHDQAHGRFIIIDGLFAFTPGASLKNIGKKADLFSEVTDPKAKQEMISNFEDWWGNATDGVSIKN